MLDNFVMYDSKYPQTLPFSFPPDQCITAWIYLCNIKKYFSAKYASHQSPYSETLPQRQHQAEETNCQCSQPSEIQRPPVCLRHAADGQFLL